jgi:hypothetical protein
VTVISPPPRPHCILPTRDLTRRWRWGCTRAHWGLAYAMMASCSSAYPPSLLFFLLGSGAPPTVKPRPSGAGSHPRAVFAAGVLAPPPTVRPSFGPPPHPPLEPKRPSLQGMGGGSWGGAARLYQSLPGSCPKGAGCKGDWGRVVGVWGREPEKLPLPRCALPLAPHTPRSSPKGRRCRGWGGSWGGAARLYQSLPGSCPKGAGCKGDWGAGCGSLG